MSTVSTRLQVFDDPNWLELDLFPDFAIPANFSYYSIERISELQMPISSQISLPNTETNRTRLGVANDASLKPADLTARVLVDGTAIYKYRLKVDSMITLGLNERIECTLIDPVKEAVEKLKDMDLSDLVNDGEYDEPFSVDGIDAINADVDEFIRIVYQDFNGFGEDEKKVFTFRPDTDFDAKDGVQQVVPALQVKQIFSKAFAEVGLTYDSQFFEGTSEIENYPVDDLYMMTPTRFYLDPSKSQPVSGTWADERTDTVAFWKSRSRANVFGLTELYSQNNPNQFGIMELNYLRRNNIIAGQAGNQHELFDVAQLNSVNGLSQSNQMVFKRPARYSLSLSESVSPSLGLFANGGNGDFFGRTDVVDAASVSSPTGNDAPTGQIDINLLVSVNGSLKTARLSTIDFEDATWDSTNKQFDWPSTQISVPSDFYIDVDAGDVVEMYITMQSQNGRLKYNHPNGNTYDLPLDEFGKNAGAGLHFLAFTLGNHSVPIYKTEPHNCPQTGNVFSSVAGCDLPLSFQEPTYEITFSPYEEFPVSSYSGSEYMDFKYNLSKVTDLSLWEVMVDIAKRFNMSMAYDFPTDTVVVDNLIEEYVQPSSATPIVYLFDNASELKQNFNTSSIKRVELLNASGNSLSDKYRASTSPFALENEVDSFGSLNLVLDEEGDREERFQSQMLLANGEIYGERFEIFDDEIFKERVKYGVPNNTPLKCSEMGLRIGFLNDAAEVRIYEPVYEVVDNMVKMQYKLDNPADASATMYEMTEESNFVTVGGDPEKYSLQFEDISDTLRHYHNFWKTFVNIINDLPSVECSLVIEAGDLSILDFKRKYDFGYGNAILTELSGFDFTLKGSKVTAKFLMY